MTTAIQAKRTYEIKIESATPIELLAQVDELIEAITDLADGGDSVGIVYFIQSSEGFYWLNELIDDGDVAIDHINYTVDRGETIATVA